MSKYLYVVLVSLFTFIFSGCGDNGEPIVFATEKNPNSINVLTLKKNWMNGKVDYNNKEVVIQGLYFHTCSTGGCNEDFTLRDGGEQITVFNTKYDLQDLTTAQPLRVTGIFKTTKQSPVIQATKIEKIEDTGEI